MFLMNSSFIQNIILNKKMPSVYINELNKIYTKYDGIDCIFPVSKNSDMHNLFKTHQYIHILKFNYKYTDYNDLYKYKNWMKLQDDNYLNFKEKLFIPNNNSYGIISRAIMHMTFKYNYDYNYIIDKNNLLKWNKNNPPDNEEIYHNNIIAEHQGFENIFISNYNNHDYYKIL
jgi:endonuclease I